MSEIFEDNKEIQQALEHYHVVTDQALKLEGQFDNAELKQTIVKEKLLPAFSTWKIEMEKVLQPFLTN